MFVFSFNKRYTHFCSQLQKDGHASIAEKLSESVNVNVEKASNDLLHIINSVNVGVKVNETRQSYFLQLQILHTRKDILVLERKLKLSYMLTSVKKHYHADEST